MALLPIHKYFIYNGNLKPVSEFVLSENEGGIYEVLRVINGVPLFLEDHLERFHKSAEIVQKKLHFSDTEIKTFLNVLIENNGVNNGNILISVKSKLKAFFIAHNYPTTKDYIEGVKCGVLSAERQNPNAKVFQSSVRQQANDLIASNNFYEVLLLNKNGWITEGSRSNVFFIKGNNIITPIAKNVLLGVTRQKTIKCANELGFEMVEYDVNFNDLTNFDAVFLTGTSPKILPVVNVGSLNFDSTNTVLRSLISSFEEMSVAYIKNARL